MLKRKIYTQLHEWKKAAEKMGLKSVCLLKVLVRSESHSS